MITFDAILGQLRSVVTKFTEKISAPSVEIPTTASAAVGTIQQNGTRLIHSYTNVNGGAADNLFIGKNAGNFTLNASYGLNVGLGEAALQSLTTGYANMAIGANALRANTTGNYSVAIGINAIQNMATPDGPNEAIGTNTMAQSSTSGYNTVFGYGSLQTATGTWGNVAMGNSSLDAYNPANDTGFCAAIGFSSLRGLTTGVDNTGVGAYSGYDTTPLTTGSYCVFIGMNSGPGVAAAGYDFMNAIGFGTKVNQANSTNIGSQAGHKVGILNPTPTETLDVNGNAKANKFICTDYTQSFLFMGA